MGKCRHCGENAGWFKSEHKECSEAKFQATGALRDAAVAALKQPERLKDLPKAIAAAERDGRVSAGEAKGILLGAWNNAVDDVLADGLMTKEEETRLGLFLRELGLTEQDFSDRRQHWRALQAGVLRDLFEGKVPDRVDFSSADLPVRLDKGERIIWIFSSVNYYEDRTRTRYVGGSQGVSFRVMKGVYYRVGAFRGEPIKSSHRVLVDTGPLVVTTKHVAFLGPAKTFRVRHSKILAVHPLSDGVVVQRDAMTAKPMIFETGDGWFIQNLLANLHSLEET